MKLLLALAFAVAALQPAAAMADLSTDYAVKVRKAMISVGYDSPAPKIPYLEKRIHHLGWWAKEFGIEQHLPLIVALVVQETKFGIEPDARYWGFGNINERWVNEYRLALRSHGWRGKIDRESLDHQAAFTVVCYWIKLGYANGDAYEAIRRYNGRGPAAQLHLDRVLNWHALIFK